MRRLPMLMLLAGLGGCAAPAPQAGGAPQRYFVFFQQWSAALDDSANQVIGAAAAQAKAQPGAPVRVVGYADPTGSAQANIQLSQLRAQVVADGLATDGIGPARIARSARGATSFEGTSQESRRVEIDVGP